MSRVHLTFLPQPELPARGRFALYRSDGSPPSAELAAVLGAATERPTRETVPLARPRGGRVDVAPTPVLTVAVGDAALQLARQPVRGQSDTLRCWVAASRIALRLIAGQRLLPSLRRAADGAVSAVWQTAPQTDPDAHAALARLAAALPPAAHSVVLDGHRVWEPEALLVAFCDAVADHAARTVDGTRAAPAARSSGRPRERLLPWTARWAEALADAEDPVVPLGDEAEELLAAVAAWQSPHSAPDDASLELSLSAPAGEQDPWRLDIGLRTLDGEAVPAAAVWHDHADLQEPLVRELAKAGRLFPPLDRLLDQPAPERTALHLREAWTLLDEAAPLLEEAGVILDLPAGLRAQALRLRLLVGSVDEDDVAAARDVQFDWEVEAGGEQLDAATLRELAAAAERAAVPLVRRGGDWLRIDPDQARRLADLTGGALPLPRALMVALADSGAAADIVDLPADTEMDVVARGGVAAMVDRLRGARELPPVPATPAGFSGTLRPYQQRGVAWLGGLASLGFGAVLADAMGLGKTIQFIAHVLVNRPDGRVLVVAPTSVLGNWERELARFAPKLEVVRWHGPDRPTAVVERGAVVVTSYGTLRRDQDILAEARWDLVAVDEAQHVKNPDTAGARALRRLQASQTVAMTGTPLENRLDELWALLDLTNPGLMGSRAGFARRFATPIERFEDPVAARQLRRLVAPFVLRREKDDPAVAADLPPKIERTVSCALTPEQAQLYEEALERHLGGDGLDGLDPMQRRGRVLALLTALKQICNHPAQYLREGDAARLPGRSGKLAAAREIVREAIDGGEQVLVFTQYVTMGRALAAQLATDLQDDIPFLHGGVPALARDRMVATFQGEAEALDAAGLDRPPGVLVVSLRAGGTGLNLTAATQVLHYDRWWNPAVEDQATDRAHRIGQHRTVEVHKLVVAGTVEERIAELLERKRSLADRIVTAGEAWVTELADDELRSLVALASDAPIEPLDDELDEGVLR